MAYVLTIGGVTKNLRAGSLSISEVANTRTNFSFDVVSTSGTYRPDIDAEVIITESGVRVAAGYVLQPSEAGLANGAIAGIVTKVQCVGYDALPDRRVILDGGFPPGFTLKDAFTSVAGFLTIYGVTVDPSQATGPTLPLMIAPSKTVRGWFDDFSTITGWVWEIDFNQVARFTEPGTVAAPVNIIDGDRHAIGDIRVEPSRVTYANRILVVCGPAGFQKRITQTWTADGSATSWVTDVPAASVVDLPEKLSEYLNAAQAALTSVETVPTVHADASEADDALSTAQTAASSALTAAQGAPANGALRTALETALGTLNSDLAPAIAAVQAEDTTITSATASVPTQAILDAATAALDAVNADKSSLTLRQTLFSAVADVLTVLSGGLASPPAPTSISTAIADLIAAVSGPQIAAALNEADISIQEARSAVKIQQALLTAYNNLASVRNVGLAQDPGVVSVDGVFRTVGTGASYEWDRATHTLSLGTDTTPTVGTIIALAYEAVWPFTVQAPLVADEPSAEQTAHGLWEIALAAPTPDDPDTKKPSPVGVATAQAFADGYLAQYSAAPKKVTYDTYATGLHPGQSQTITCAKRNISASFLITEVQSKTTGANVLIRTVTAVQGTVVTKTFRDVLKQWSSGGSASTATTASGVPSATPALTLSSPAFLGGSDTLYRAADTWTRVPNALTYVASSAVSVGLRGSIAAHQSVTVTLRLYDVTASIAAFTGSAVAANVTPADYTAGPGTLTAGHAYILQMLSGTSGVPVAGLAQLESA